MLPIRRAEELISTLPGVLSVRIVPNETGAIDEIHVLTTDQVAPKQTVRNIESALIAQLGLRVNHRKISIATTLDPPKAVDLPPSAPSAPSVEVPSGPVAVPSGRPAVASSPGAAGASPVAGVSPAGRRLLVFDDVEVRRSRSRGVTCRVTLRQGDVEYAGEAEGPESERSRVDLAARAAVAAVTEAAQALRPGERPLALEGAQLLEAFAREFVFVTVLARQGRETLVLTGTCEVRDGAETSAVLAVLDATNRWMQQDR